MIAGDGFRWGNFYGSYSASEDFDGIGFELGMMDVPSVDNKKSHAPFLLQLKYHILYLQSVGFLVKDRIWNILYIYEDCAIGKEQ